MDRLTLRSAERPHLVVQTPCGTEVQPQGVFALIWGLSVLLAESSNDQGDKRAGVKKGQAPFRIKAQSNALVTGGR